MNSIRLACAQIKLENTKNWADIKDEILDIVRFCSTNKTDIIILPSFIFFYLSGGYNNTIQDFFNIYNHRKALEVKDMYLTYIQKLCKKYGVIICPGNLWEYHEGGIRNCSYIIDERGQTIGNQAQTHINIWEKQLNFTGSSCINVIKTEKCNIGILMGCDCWVPELGRILSLSGANILIGLNYLLWKNYNYQLSGIWQQVQQNQVFAAEVMPSGRLFGLKLYGCPSIYGPCEITQGQTGIIAKQSYNDTQGIITAQIDFNKREELIEKYDILKCLNPSLYNKYFPHIYGYGKGNDN
jgi:predicted amidohydrolase